MTASAAAYYEVRYREIGTESWSAPQRFNPAAELTIVGLDRDKDYEAEVRAVSACGAKSAWVPENYTTPGDPAGTIKLSDVDANASDAKAKTDAGLEADGKIKDGLNELDRIIDGPVYGRPIKTRLSAGKPLIDFGESIHIGKNIDNIGDGTTYRRVGAGYADSSGRVTKLWDGTLPRDAADVWTGVSRATAGLNSSGDVNRDVPGARMKWGNGLVLDDLRPAQAGADVTSRNAVYGPNSIVNPGAETGELYPHKTTNSGGTWSVGNPDGRLHSGANAFLYSYAGQTGEAIIAFNQPGGASDVSLLPEAQEGEVWKFTGHTYDFGTGAGATCKCYLTFRNEAGTSVGSTIVDVRASGTGDYPFQVIAKAPAGTCFASASIRVQTDSEHTGYLIIDDVELRKATVEDAGSNVRVGDQRNLPQSNVNTLGSVPSTTALTATAAGAISVNAHTTYMGGSSVAYSAVANAITGKAQSTTWVVYCLDPDYTGGAQTWLAASTMNAAMQAGDGVYIAGIVTIPTSGTGSGGTGGDGDPDLCMDYGSCLPDGRLMRDLVPGRDYAWCVDVRTGERELVQLRAMGEGYEDCYLLASPRGCVIQSVSTPMDLPDGRVVRTPEMLGELVVPWAGGTEPVDTLIYLGRRRVLKPDFGNRMVYAGISPNRCLATHNARWKP